jgi:thiol:disulfide interchange protein
MSSSDTKKRRPWWIRLLAIAALGLAAYFANVEIQSYFGKKARESLELEMLGLDEAKQRAALEKKPILVELSAVWCPSCRHFDKTVLGDPLVQTKIITEYIFAHVEYESESGKAFMETYGAHGFPTTYILSPDGALVRKLDTTMNPSDYVQQL